MEQFFIAITEYFAGPLGLVELIGTIFSLICVYLAVKHNQWTWFFGVLGVLAFGYLFLQYALISDAMLQLLFFLPLQFVGFFVWRNVAKRADNDREVKALSGLSFIGIILFIAAMTLLNGAAMATYGMQIMAWLNSTFTFTGLSFPVVAAAFPYADAFTTWMSVAAQILMIAKYRESWVLWVVMDAAAIGIYLAKGLVVTSGLYAVFFVLAAIGGIAWYKQYKAQQKPDTNIWGV